MAELFIFSIFLSFHSKLKSRLNLCCCCLNLWIIQINIYNKLKTKNYYNFFFLPISSSSAAFFVSALLSSLDFLSRSFSWGACSSDDILSFMKKKMQHINRKYWTWNKHHTNLNSGVKSNTLWSNFWAYEIKSFQV